MKKTYIIPNIEIVKLKAYNQLLTVSGVYEDLPEEYGTRELDFEEDEDLESDFDMSDVEN